MQAVFLAAVEAADGTKRAALLDRDCAGASVSVEAVNGHGQEIRTPQPLPKWLQSLGSLVFATKTTGPVIRFKTTESAARSIDLFGRRRLVCQLGRALCAMQLALDKDVQR